MKGRHVVLGICATHDAGVALVIDGKLVAAASEERFTKNKHHYGFPEQSLAFVLAHAGLHPNDVTSVGVAGRSLPFSARVAARTVMRSPRTVIEALRRRETAQGDSWTRSGDVDSWLADKGIHATRHRVLHHAGHASYGAHSATRKTALVLSLDGQGDALSGGVYVSRNGRVERVAEHLAKGGSLGHAYSLVTYGLGFKVNDGEGKTMGLACYGKTTRARAALDPYFPRAHGLEMSGGVPLRFGAKIDGKRLVATYDAYKPLITRLVEDHGREDVALSCQELLEDRVDPLLRKAIETTGIREVVGVGGVFLNVKMTLVLSERLGLDYVYVPPHPGDGGLAAGFAFEAHTRDAPDVPIEPLVDPYLGPAYDDASIEKALAAFDDLEAERCDDIARRTAQRLVDGKVVGWFQGRMEWGNRALGARSVLADPRDPAVRDRINHHLKNRDWFMPFAPSVLSEACDGLFHDFTFSPFMNHCFRVREAHKRDIPAATHVDGTARPHQVSERTSPLYHRMISAFREQTGVPAVLNTSFNRHGLPIVCTPKDALDHLAWGCVDELAIGSFLVRRKGEPRPYTDPREDD